MSSYNSPIAWQAGIYPTEIDPKDRRRRRSLTVPATSTHAVEASTPLPAIPATAAATPAGFDRVASRDPLSLEVSRAESPSEVPADAKRQADKVSPERSAAAERSEEDTSLEGMPVSLDESTYEITRHALAERGEPAELEPVSYVVMEMTPVISIDSTALHMLEDLKTDLKRRGVYLCFASTGNRVEAIMKRAGLVNKIGTTWFHPTVHAAVQFCVWHRQNLQSGPEGATPALSEPDELAVHSPRSLTEDDAHSTTGSNPSNEDPDDRNPRFKPDLRTDEASIEVEVVSMATPPDGSARNSTRSSPRSSRSTPPPYLGAEYLGAEELGPDRPTEVEVEGIVLSRGGREKTPLLSPQLAEADPQVPPPLSL